MPNVIFAAPLLSENASRMIAAVGSLRGVRLGVISSDPRENAPEFVQPHIHAHWRIDDVLDAGQLEWAATQLAVQMGPADRLFGAYEQLQVPLAEVRERMGIAGLSSESARNFRDKARMKDVLRAAGVPVARHQLVENWADADTFVRDVGFPVVVKPPAGAGSVATFRADDVDGLERALRETAPGAGEPALVEEFMTGDEHSLETISIDGRQVWHSLTHYYPTPLEVVRNPWIQWCVVLPREVDEPQYDDAKRIGDAALQALGMTTGLTHMEWFRRRDGSVAVSEIAARPPGAQITTLVSRATDTDFVRSWAEVMVFGTFTPPERKYATGVAFLRAQGQTGGRISAVHGLDQVRADVKGIVVDAQLPTLGAEARPTYEGDGFVIVRHTETDAVMEALHDVISNVRVVLT